MTLHLLDADAAIDYLYGISASVALLDGLTRGGNILCSSAVTIGEVHSGLYPHEQQRGNAYLSGLHFLPTSAGAARQAGQWRFSFARRGITLSITDCLVAATALEHQAVVITGNLRHYPMPEITVLPLPRNR
jgi:tRNA(fMet)-specific endonuclease VapC